MENEKEKKYFIIWLYISILLHLLVVIIMLTIKPTTSTSTDPDPASGIYDTQVIFMQEPSESANLTLDKPEPEEAKQPEYKIATRIQGGVTGSQQDSTEQSSVIKSTADTKEAQFDKPEAALSDVYKKGMRNQANTEDQVHDGVVDVLQDATIGLEEQRERQVLPQAEGVAMPVTTSQAEQLRADTTNELKALVKAQDKKFNSAEILKVVISENIERQAINQLDQDSDRRLEKFDSTKESLQPLAQKIISKKHRPADTGLENISKVQLSKETQEITPAKKKMSLMDIKQGFSQFIKNSSTKQIATPTSSTLGNSLFFSSTGNAQKDDELGLKLASYMHQIGKMYDSAGSLYSDLIVKLLRKNGYPSENNRINIKIERSGKISEIRTIQSCGNQAIDNYHVKIIESIGDLPPVPKYIETPLCVGAQFTFKR